MHQSAFCFIPHYFYILIRVCSDVIGGGDSKDSRRNDRRRNVGGGIAIGHYAMIIGSNLNIGIWSLLGLTSSLGDSVSHSIDKLLQLIEVLTLVLLCLDECTTFDLLSTIFC